MNTGKGNENSWKEQPIWFAICAIWMLLSILLSLPVLCVVWIIRWIRTGTCKNQHLIRMMNDVKGGN